MMGLVTVGLEENLLEIEEVAMLKRGPKFYFRRVLCEERFLLKWKKRFCKIRWSERDKHPIDKENETDEEGKGKRESGKTGNQYLIGV